MPPHGRRRLSNLSFIIVLLFLCTSTASAASAVLGIDLGTEFIKAALVKPGIPLEIVLTKDSRRKETAAVAFKPLRLRVNTAETDSYPERIYGNDALALSARFPSDVYANIKPLLGLRLTDDLVSEYAGIHTGLKLVESAEAGTVGFKSDSFAAEEEPWLIEELLAMELKNIKANAETMAGKGSTISDAVITVPSFYTVEERRAITMAAEMAGLRILSLISDGLSVGLNYATSRTFPTVNEGGKPEIHLIYDMGAGSTTATVLKFQGRTVKDVGKYNKTIQEVQVLGTGWDKTLGGDALNRIIMEDMIEKIVATNHMKSVGLRATHFRSHGRSMAKLWKESERVRQVLSANTETQSTFENLYYEDFSFKYKISRGEFEKLASKYLDRVRNPLEEALESAKLSLSDIESVILHGGAVRTPFVQKQLEAAITGSDKIRTNVNADEAAVFGAAFKAATISPSFRVKEIRTADSAVYPILASWSLEGKEKQQKLFVPTSQIGTQKQVSVKVIEDFSFRLYQQSSAELPVSNIKTVNLTDSVKTLTDKFGCPVEDISTKFALRLSPTDSLPEVVSGFVSCEVIESAESKKGGVVDGVKDFLGFGSKKGDQEPLQDDFSESLTSISEPETSSSVISSAVEEGTTSSTLAKAKDQEEPKEVKKRTQTIHVGFSTEIAGVSNKPEALRRMKARLSAFDKSDKSRIMREETLNNLEGYTYRIRDILEDEGIIDVSTGKQRDEIESKSNDASMWLYGDGAEAGRESLKARLDELRGLVEPIQRRKDEVKTRPSEVQKLKDALQQADTMVSVMKQQREVQMTEASAAEASKASDTSSSQTPTAPVSADDFAGLDDEPNTISSSTTSAASKLQAPAFNEEELIAVSKKKELVQKWLDEKLAEQEKLSPTDDPIILSTDLSKKSEEINDAVMNLLTKQLKVPPKPKKSKTASSKSAKTISVKATDTSSIDTESALKETTRPTADTEEGPPDEIDEAIVEQKSRAEKTKKSADPKSTTKGKSTGKGKSKGRDKGKYKATVEVHEEL